MKNYIIFDRSNNQKYLFIGKKTLDNENEIVIDNMIKNRTATGKLGLNDISFKILNRLFTGLPTKKDVDKYIIYRYSLETLTIMDLKKLLLVLLDTPINSMHLWINNILLETYIKNSIKNRIKHDGIDINPNYNDLPEIFGYKFKNDNGIQYINPNINKFIESRFKIDYTNQLHDEHSNIIGNYQIKNNIINLNNINNINNLLEIDKKETNHLIKDLKHLFFPRTHILSQDNSKESIENRKIYTEIYQELSNNITMFNIINQENKSIPIYNIVYNNLIVYLNINIGNDIDIENIFYTIELDKNIPFMKYKNTLKSGIEYRIFNGINNIKKKDSSLDFTDYRKYLIEYESNKYEPIIDKKTLDKWKNNQYVIRENEYNTNNIEELVIKINMDEIHKGLFCHLCIDYKGACKIKIIDDAVNLTDKEINAVYKKINDVLKNIKYASGSRQLIDIKSESNLKYISVNTLCSINTSDFIPEKNITLNSIKKILDMYYSRCYIIEYNKENIIINYKITDIYNNFTNLKKYFFLLKSRYPDYNIKKFTELWINESRSKFNISSIDSLKILENILADPTDFNPLKIINDEINIIITKGNQPNEFIITIMNSNSKKESTEIIKFIETIFYSLTKEIKPKKQIVEPNSKPKKQIVEPILNPK